MHRQAGASLPEPLVSERGSTMRTMPTTDIAMPATVPRENFLWYTSPSTRSDRTGKAPIMREISEAVDRASPTFSKMWFSV